MLYDIRLKLDYTYDRPVAGGRHALRVQPSSAAPGQNVRSGKIAVEPAPLEWMEGRDFFDNAVTTLVFREAHDALSIAMTARVEVRRSPANLAGAVPHGDLPAELSATHSVAAESPHHFLAPSPLVGALPAITAYAAEKSGSEQHVSDIVREFGLRIHRDFRFDPEATDVQTPPEAAFALKRGVCQDFTHVMIAGLRGIGIPAGYVSGFLRTNPPPGRPRLEGTDAMHAWVRAWCGRDCGWIEFDPTNATFAGDDHITVAVGRDYSDVAPIIGRMRMSGGQGGQQSVTVEPIG